MIQRIKLGHFCSMKITQGVREYAAQKEIDEQTALGLGMKEKAAEFAATGGDLHGPPSTGAGIHAPNGFRRLIESLHKSRLRALCAVRMR